MVATKSLLSSWVIDTKENCDVITLDVPSVFAEHSMPESVSGKIAILKICRVWVGMLCEIALEVYEDCMTCNNNNNN